MATAQINSKRMFPALLKYWRGRRGFSQLDLGLAADVSARHISFLETGRSQPSVEMVLLLAEVLDVPLRDRNELLRAAGFAGEYPEEELADVLEGPLRTVIDTMLTQHEPFPMVVVDRLYNIVVANNAALFLTAAFFDDSDSAADLNLLRVLFTSATARERIVNWPEVASNTLRRIQREVLHAPSDEALRSLHDELVEHEATPESWRTPDLGSASNPFVPVRMLLPEVDQELSFLTTITTFNAPQNVALDEMMIEAWYPADEATEHHCRSVAESPSG